MISLHCYIQFHHYTHSVRQLCFYSYCNMYLHRPSILLITMHHLPNNSDTHYTLSQKNPFLQTAFQCKIMQIWKICGLHMLKRSKPRAYNQLWLSFERLIQNFCKLTLHHKQKNYSKFLLQKLLEKSWYMVCFQRKKHFSLTVSLTKLTCKRLTRILKCKRLTITYPSIALSTGCHVHDENRRLTDVGTDKATVCVTGMY